MATALKESLAKVDAQKAEVDALRPLTPDQEQRVFQKLRLDWNYHSNAIEGNQLSPGETRLLLMEGLTANGKPLKDYLDVKGHNHVIDFLLDFISRKQELTEATIREMHRLLLVQSYEVVAVTAEGGQTKKWVKLGQYKEEPNQITTPTGEVRRFVLPPDVPAQMGELMRRLRKQQQNPDLHPIAFASLFHHEFVSIHPFDDGNGRMARLLMNLLLMQAHYPPAVIRMQDREQYFVALAQADDQDLEPFTIFMAEQVFRSLDLYLRAAKGETIEDYDDIDKKIALLKKELESEPEPQVFSPEIYADFIRGSLSRLLTKIFAKTKPLDSLYLRSQFHLDLSGLRSTSPEKNVPAILNVLLKAGLQYRMEFNFFWDEFKKAGTNTFGHNSILSLRFSDLTYEVQLDRYPSIKRLYAAELTEEECREIANTMAQDLYHRIQSQRALMQPQRAAKPRASRP